MVNAQQYLDTNYPTANRVNITSLDLSNLNLEDVISIKGFTNLKKFDISSNPNLDSVTIDSVTIEEMNISNTSSRIPGGNFELPLSKLRKLNNSYASIMTIGLVAPALTHLDVSNNLLKNLDLSYCNRLVEIDCSNNPALADLLPPINFDPIFLNCQNTKLNKINTSSFVFDCQKGTKLSKIDADSPVTTEINNSLPLTIGLATGLGVLALLASTLAGLFWYKWRKPQNNPIPTPGSS